MKGLQRALADLKLGKIIAYPSEGVWGLGCDPQNEEAVYKLLKSVSYTHLRAHET